jgi:hypothetical protein
VSTYAQTPGWVNVGLPPRAVQVYNVLAEFAAYDDSNRICWPSVTTLAERLGCSVRTVQSAIRRLVNAGAVAVEARWRRNGSQSSNLYRLAGVREVAPPEREVLLLPTADGGSDAGRARAGEAAVVMESLPGMEPEPERAAARPWPSQRLEKVGRKRVTADEASLAEQVVAKFCELTGRRSASSRSNLAMVVSRIREYPALELAHYEWIIRRVLAAPWWDGDGPPELRMIFSPEAFGIAEGQASEWDGGPVERPRRRGEGAPARLDRAIAVADELRRQGR